MAIFFLFGKAAKYINIVVIAVCNINDLLLPKYIAILKNTAKKTKAL